MGDSYDGRERASSHLLASAALKKHVVERCMGDILAAAELLADTFRRGGKVFLCGNGGSAADCQHVAGEFVSLLNKDNHRPALPAIALTTDSSFLTAYANDFGYEGVFRRQLEALAAPGDALVGISTSGGSVNVTKALEYAREAGVKSIVLMGEGGAMQEIGDVVVAIPSTDTQLIQEAHLTVEHVLCDLVEMELYPAISAG
jgi:D-sedoheptulose 7-phosphate isomerase